ncbi:hypothetical protein ACFVHB_08870 [Kitasatospora sp. NPDC127111]|uniref:hypothetical protein n=1 Tax=Kitasatospora sp. NPDC127111 TaxID=3345363 RepID=UPI00362F0CBD
MVDQDVLLRARVVLLSSNNRILRGPRALEVYRVLASAAPEVYGSKLVVVLLRGAVALAGSDPAKARAVVEEAVAVAEALEERNPFRAEVLALALAHRELV